MSTITATLLNGQTLTVGSASSREAYEVEVSSGLVGPSGIGIVSANVSGGMLNLTLSNTAIINAGSVMASANTGTITFTGNTIGQLNNNSINIVTNGKEWTFGENGLFSIPDGIYANGTTGANGQVLTSNGTSAHWADVLNANTGSVVFTSTTMTSSNADLVIVTTHNTPFASPAINTTSSWVFDRDGNLSMPGMVASSTVDKTGGNHGFETILDTSKTINKLTTGSYFLGDGAEGQVMYLVPQSGITQAVNVDVVVGNARTVTNSGTDWVLYPFRAADATGTTDSDICTLIFTDGAWQMRGGLWE
jgi:hypothetical protein